MFDRPTKLSMGINYKGLSEPLRDGFSVTRLYRLRRFTEKRPFFFTIHFIAVAMFWTYAMSYSAAIFGDNKFAVQYAPSIAFAAMPVGLLIYPLRLIWIPSAVFGVALLAPIALPFVIQPTWDVLRSDVPHIIALFLGLNVLAALSTGALALFVFARLRGPLAPYTADLALALVLQGTFLFVNLVLVVLLILVMQDLPAQTQDLLGYDEHFRDLAIKRVLRGASATLICQLLFLHRPKSSELFYVLLIIIAFFILGLLHASGFTVNQELEAGLVLLIVTLVVPTSIAPLGIILSVVLYALMTGAFISDRVPVDVIENVADYYGILLLAIGGYILAYRGYLDLRDQTISDSIVRLDTVRDFAGVGVIQVNQLRGTVQLDQTSMRVMGIDTVFSKLDSFYERLSPESQVQLFEIGEVQPGDTYSVVLRVIRGPDDERVIRVFIWAQLVENGEILAYGLILDITEEQSTQRALRNALEDLELRDEKLRRMFSIVSHEIRTPASIMAMLIEDLQSATIAISKPQLTEASHQLLGVLADMRQAVNPEENLAIVKKAYAPAKLAETVRNTYQSQAARHQMDIKLQLGEGAHVLWSGDQMRVKQMIGNLVRNALLHSRGRTVEIGFKRELDAQGQNWTVWTISDDGVGIAPEEVDRLYEPFERGGDDPRNQADGSGLGLYIVKKSVELLGGTINYTQPSSGTCYRIRIPENIATVAEETNKPKRDTSGLSKLHILLAEDNELVARVTKGRLEKIFASVTVAANGAEAFDQAILQQPDVLITDLFMPKLEGDKLIHLLRAAGHDYPMIGWTAATVGSDMDRFKLAGADLVMPKPMDKEALVLFLSK